MALAFPAPRSPTVVLPRPVGRRLGPQTQRQETHAVRAALAVAMVLPAQRQCHARRCSSRGSDPACLQADSPEPWAWWGAGTAEEWPQLLEELMTDARGLLKEFFGHDAFRPKQEEALRAAISREDIELYWPTAAGKSLVFQLLAVLAWRRKRGIIVVVEPTIPVMQDQTQQFNAKARSAKLAEDPKACLLGSAQKDEAIISAAVAGEYCLVYMCPESATQKYLEAFVDLYDCSRLCAFVVDEACYMPLWGHEFRTAFLDLEWLRDTYRTVPCMALSGAAPPARQAFIRKQLQLRAPHSSTRPMFRKNLVLESCQGLTEKEKLEMVLNLLTTDGYKAAVVYVLTKPTASRIQRRLEEECEKRDLDLVVRHLDGDTPPDERAELNEEFRENRISIMVATDAYGQGIDKPDIDVIVHWQPPLNMETYVNQIGRAGRDGRHSLCRLCWSNSNDWNMMLHDKGYFAQELKQLMAQDLEVELESRVALLSIVTEHRCRWHGILSHYACAAELEVPRGCGVCDVCVGKEVGMKRSTASDGEQNLALLILDCVKFASSHGEATKGRVIQIAREGASGFRHPCSVGMLEAIEAKRCRLPGPPLKRALEDMFLRLQDSGYLLPCLPSYAIQQPMKKLSWGVELSRSGLEALSRDGVIQLVPERRGTSGSESKQHRQTIRQLKKALKEFASVKGDPEALEDALIHLQHVASDQACKSKPPVKRDAPPRVKQDETDSVLRQMKGICPDMQIRYENLGPDQRQFIMEIPSQQIKHSGKPSRYESVSRKDALETIKIPVKKWWVPRYVGDNLRDDDVSCNVKLGKQAMWKAEIYVKPSGKTFASRRSFPRWVDAVWSAIASVPENNMFQKRVKLE